MACRTFNRGQHNNQNTKEICDLRKPKWEAVSVRTFYFYAWHIGVLLAILLKGGQLLDLCFTFSFHMEIMYSGCSANVSIYSL